MYAFLSEGWSGLTLAGCLLLQLCAVLRVHLLLALLDGLQHLEQGTALLAVKGQADRQSAAAVYQTSRLPATCSSGWPAAPSALPC